MWSAIHNSTRLLLASMAFTMAFFLTPRAWISGARTPSQTEVPVDALDQSKDSCLWCDAPASTPPPCDEDRKWYEPEAPSAESEDCPDSSSSATGPNA